MPTHYLDQPWSLDGEWWEPSDPSQKIAGVLQYDPEKGLTVELRGLLPSQRTAKALEAREYEVLHGRLDGGRDCSLLDVLVSVSGKAAAQWLIVGPHVTSRSQACYPSSSITLGNLAEWLPWRPLGFPRVTKKKKHVSLRYVPRKKIVAKVPKLNATISIRSTVSTSSEGFQSQTITHEAAIDIDANGDEAQDLVWHTSIHAALRDLVTLLSGSASWIRTCEAGGARCELAPNG